MASLDSRTRAHRRRSRRIDAGAYDRVTEVIRAMHERSTASWRMWALPSPDVSAIPGRLLVVLLSW
jgi:hypothetical protein